MTLENTTTVGLGYELVEEYEKLTKKAKARFDGLEGFANAAFRYYLHRVKALESWELLEFVPEKEMGYHNAPEIIEAIGEGKANDDRYDSASFIVNSSLCQCIRRPHE